jgi:hypothetical protein
MPTIDAQGRTISDDGQWWWDGTAWQPIRKGFLDTLADSVEGAVNKLEGSPTPAATSPAATTPAAAAPAPAAETPAAAYTPAETAPAPAEPVPAQAFAPPVETAPAPTAPAPVEATPTPAPAAPVIPPADLLAYLGALKHAGVVTDAEYESIRMRIPGQA